MSVVIVVGAQWGDEGKGKVVDLFTEHADVVVRYAGGANAGHTLVLDGRKLVTHLVPSGVLHPGTRCVLGGGMVIDPYTLIAEIDECRERGLLPAGDLLIAEQAHVILPYHKLIEGLREDRKKHAIGTTRRGIGPAYESKAARRGVRIGDLLVAERLRDRVEQNLEELAPLIRDFGGKVPDAAEIDAMIDAALGAGERLRDSVGNVGREVNEAIDAGKNVLFEGAQGALLDVDHGTYPYVTSSNTIAAGACTSVGVGPTRIDRVVGITKAYLTRVGAGPFPTELDGEEAEELRKAGGEFGATTGRPRRCGWLDIPALRLAIRVNGLSSLALTKLDVLAGRSEVKVCVGYTVDGTEVDELPSDPDLIERAEPRYRVFEGWPEASGEVRALDDLPAGAQRYVAALEELTGVPFALVSVGPDRNETISLQDPFAG
jgi:adenylosuccinate synthase